MSDIMPASVAAPAASKKPRKLPKTLDRAELKAQQKTLEQALARRVHGSHACAYEAQVILSLDRRPVPGFGTFAVGIVKGRFVLYYDPIYMQSISERELDVTLMHEVMHLTMHHHARGEAVRQRFNFKSADKREKSVQVRAHALAADYAINEILARTETDMRAPGKPIGYWAFPDEYDLPAQRTYEEYFELLLPILRTKRDEREALLRELLNHGGWGGTVLELMLYGPPGGERQLGDGPPRNLEELLEAVDALLDLVEADVQDDSAVLSGPSIPGHRGEDDPRHAGDRDPLMLPTEEELAQATEQLLKDADGSLAGQGRSTPGRYQRIHIAPPPEKLTGVDGLLRAMRRAIPSHQGGGYRTSMRNVNRGMAARAQHARRRGGPLAQFASRMPLVPGYAQQTALCAAIVLDTSVSMSQRSLSYAIGVVRDVMEQLEIAEAALLTVDDRLTSVIKLERGGELPQNLVGGGGTEFDPGLRGAMAWAQEHGFSLDLIVYITDGDASDPEFTVPVPVIWALVGCAYPVLEGVAGHENVFLTKDDD